jgi:hypothetical protein
MVCSLTAAVQSLRMITTLTGKMLNFNDNVRVHVSYKCSLVGFL